MATSIDISSNALLLIGDNPINSFDEPGAGAQVAGALYSDTKTRLLSSHPWSFAIKQQRLNRLSEAPDDKTGYRYAFQLPTDLIRLWSIDTKDNYTIVGNLLYSNQTSLLATYIYNVDEVNLPPHFIKALEYMLAADFAIAIMEDENRNALYERKGRDMTNQAMAIDSQSRPQVPIVNSPLIDARFGSYGRYGRTVY